jgi:hypothetical protein
MLVSRHDTAKSLRSERFTSFIVCPRTLEDWRPMLEMIMLMLAGLPNRLPAVRALLGSGYMTGSLR